MSRRPAEVSTAKAVPVHLLTDDDQAAKAVVVPAGQDQIYSSTVDALSIATWIDPNRVLLLVSLAGLSAIGVLAALMIFAAFRFQSIRRRVEGSESPQRQKRKKGRHQSLASCEDDAPSSDEGTVLEYL